MKSDDSIHPVLARPLLDIDGFPEDVALAMEHNHILTVGEFARAIVFRWPDELTEISARLHLGADTLDRAIGQVADMLPEETLGYLLEQRKQATMRRTGLRGHGQKE